jgi:hypothetical protein
MPIEELTGLLARWHAADGRLARAGVLREAAETLRGLSVTDRRALGTALAEQGMEGLATPLIGGRDLGGDAGHALADDLLALDTDRVLDVLTSLEERASHLPPPPPPPGTDAPPDPQPEPPPERRPGSPPEPQPAPSPEPQPEPAPEEPALDPAVRAEEPPAPAPSEPASTVGHATPGRPAVTPAPEGGRSRPAARRGGFELPQPADVDDALAQLRALPAGWRRRRAAVRWLEEGVLAGVEPATLLGEFGQIADRRRVADQLLATGQVDPARLVDQLPAPVVRRLARRRARRT